MAREFLIFISLPLWRVHYPASDDPPGRSHFTFTAANDHEARQTGRKVMNGQGSAEI